MISNLAFPARERGVGLLVAEEVANPQPCSGPVIRLATTILVIGMVVLAMNLAARDNRAMTAPPATGQPAKVPTGGPQAIVERIG